MVVERVDGTELRFKNPGRLLLVVFGFLFWAIGFIDLLGHTSAEPDVFGLLSINLGCYQCNVGPTPRILSINLGPKRRCYQVQAPMLSSRYT